MIYLGPTIEVPVIGHPIKAAIQSESESTFKRRRNKKIAACIGLLAGTAFRLESRSLYQDYLNDGNEATRQATYEKADQYHKISLGATALGSFLFVIPVGQKK